MALVNPSTFLISVDNFVRLQQIRETDASSHDHLEVAIAMASKQLVTLSGREFLLGSTAETFHGTGRYNYWLRHGRILDDSYYLVEDEQVLGITDPVLYYYAGSELGTNWVETDRNWEYEPETGEIWFPDSAEKFYESQGRPNWKIDYWYGWTQDDMPGDIQLICARLAKLILIQIEHDGIASLSTEMGSTAYSLSIPSDIRSQIMNNWRAGIN